MKDNTPPPKLPAWLPLSIVTILGINVYAFTYGIPKWFFYLTNFGLLPVVLLLNVRALSRLNRR